MTCSGFSLAASLMPAWMSSKGNSQRAGPVLSVSLRSKSQPSGKQQDFQNISLHTQVGTSVHNQTVSPVTVNLLFFFGSGWGVFDDCLTRDHLLHPFPENYTCWVTAELQNEKELCCVARSHKFLDSSIVGTFIHSSLLEQSPAVSLFLVQGLGLLAVSGLWRSCETLVQPL